MHKLVLYVLLAVFYLTLHALQVDEEMAMHTLFRAKHALNRSTHAAAQQLDSAKLARGVYSIDPLSAESTALLYLQSNLSLTSTNDPQPGTFFRTKIKVQVLEVINETQAFPYTYTNATFDYEVTLEKPGVIMIIEVEYPRTYQVMGPITWQIKGAAELVYDG